MLLVFSLVGQRKAIRLLIGVFGLQVGIILRRELAGGIGQSMILLINEVRKLLLRHKRLGQRFRNGSEHRNQKLYIVCRHRLDRCPVINLSCGKAPVKMPPRVFGDNIPEHSLCSTVAFAEWVQDIEVVVTDAQPCDEVFVAKTTEQIILMEHALGILDTCIKEIKRLERFAIAFGHIDLPDMAGPLIDILEQVMMNPLKLFQCSLGTGQLPVKRGTSSNNRIILEYIKFGLGEYPGLIGKNGCMRNEVWIKCSFHHALASKPYRLRIRETNSLSSMRPWA